MKLITIIALFGMAVRLAAADKPTDPLAGAFFSPEIVLMARDQIGLTEAQREAFRTRVEKTKLRSDELTQQLGRESAALATLARKDRVEEAALVEQLDKVLDAERDLKHLHLGLLAFIKNLLTPEQQSRLRELTKDGAAPLVEAMRNRLTEKVGRVQEGMKKWVAKGRDPSEIGKTMEEKIKPLIEGGKPFDADAELDRVLEQLKQGAN